MNEQVTDGAAAALTATRRAWHAVAELVLAGPQYRRSGTIRLRVTAGGFATITEPTIEIDGGDLVANGVRLGLDGRTCTELATAIGVDAGKPADLYADGSDLAEDATLQVDRAAVRRLAAALSIGDAALRRLDPEQTPVLWPEHFDVGISANEVNYGVSAGDSYLPEPYAYVGPWQLRPGDFWNAPFGATRPATELPDVDAVLAFFVLGRTLAHT